MSEAEDPLYDPDAEYMFDRILPDGSALVLSPITHADYETCGVEDAGLGDE
jgi:hypothetical protein